MATQVVLITACLATLVPVVFLFLDSFKTLPQFFSDPYGLPPDLDFTNYIHAWSDAGVASGLAISVMATAGGVLLNLVVSVPASYAFSRLHFRLRGFLYLALVAGFVVPVQLILLPLLIMIKAINLNGSVLSLVIAYASLTLPMSVLFLTSFFGSLPREIEEAARVDGAHSVQVLVRIVIPLATPGLVAVTILNGVWIWNDFIVALYLATTPGIQTLPLAIMQFFGSYSTEWTLAFASVAIAAAPMFILYVLLTRYFVAGLTAGAVRG